MQTSFENIFLQTPSTAVTNRNLSMTDKSIQTSLQSLHQKEFGTQTRKSATKKRKKRRQEETEEVHDLENHLEDGNENDAAVDPVLQLLTPS